MARINSRNKGKVGELEWAKECRKHGYEARRGQQHAGGADSPDVVTDIPGIHFEVKRVETLRLYDALDQAKRDAGPGKKGVVAYRKNHMNWAVILRADDFFGMLEDLQNQADVIDKYEENE